MKPSRPVSLEVWDRCWAKMWGQIWWGRIPFSIIVVGELANGVKSRLNDVTDPVWDDIDDPPEGFR